jgi:hypothetical protein
MGMVASPVLNDQNHQKERKGSYHKKTETLTKQHMKVVKK